MMRLPPAVLPLAGAIAGAAGAAIFVYGGGVAPGWLASLATVVFWFAVAGVPHEKTSSVTRILIVASIVARWLALDHLATPYVWEVLIASQAAARAAMVALAWLSRPAWHDRGLAFSRNLKTPSALAAIAVGVAAAFACGLEAGALILAGGYIVIRAAQMYFYRRHGGVNLDALGAAEQSMELYILLLFACRNCVT